MELFLATIADCANVSDMGKMNIMGIFRQIYSPFAPCRHPQCTVALILRTAEDEKGTVHAFSLAIRDADGRKLMESPPATFQIPDAPVGINPEVNLVINMALDLPRFGDYTIHIFVDGNELGSIPLTLHPIIGQGQG